VVPNLGVRLRKGDNVNAEEIAKIIASTLDVRDDIASAQVIEDKDAPAQVGVETQGGGTFFVTVEPA